jgi:hypothetical protein
MLIEIKMGMQQLTELFMAMRPEIANSLPTPINGQPCPTDRADEFLVTTQKLFEELEVKMRHDATLKTQIRKALTLVGTNEILKAIVRSVLKNLMSKELRMTYFALKATKGKHVFTDMKMICLFVMGKFLKQFLFFLPVLIFFVYSLI